MVAATRKVCIVGDFGVGKTSTVARFVHNVFSEKYLTTVGVKIDTKEVDLGDGNALKLVIWDIAGTDRFSAVEFSYLRGSAGYLMVADGTRAPTLDTLRKLEREARQRYGQQPTVTLLNKWDLQDLWEIPNEAVGELEADGHAVFRTSAKTGENVEAALAELVRRILADG